MTVWFTSDLHLGDRKVSELRGYDTPDDHDDDLIGSIMLQAKAGDEVWILGDMVGRKEFLEQALRELANAKEFIGLRGLHLIPGNHDPVHPRNYSSHNYHRRYFPTFDSVQVFARRKVAGETVWLSHFPFEGDHTPEDRWTDVRLPKSVDDWILHGHTHSGEGFVKGSKQIHVGWDAWGRMVSLDEIAVFIQKESK